MTTFHADILTAPAATPVPPFVPRQPVTPAATRREADNQRQEKPDGGENRALHFRAALNAATVGNLATALGRAEPADRVAEPPSRSAKLPDRAPLVLTGRDPESVFLRSAPETPHPRAREYGTATSRYAASFFAGSPFYARPGDTLELTA